MKKIKAKLADMFYAIAIWIDPRLHKFERIDDVLKYGTSIVKRINPRDFNLAD